MPTNASSILRTSLPAARAGSRDALGQTLNQCRAYLLEVARRALGPGLRAKGGASDLVQDTFLEAQRRFGQFDGDSNGQLRAWLRSLLLHKAAKLGRRYHGTHKRQLSREIPLGRDGASTVHPSEVASRGPSPSVLVTADEQKRRLLQAIDRLPDDYRAVMTLRYQEALPFDEIGRRLGRSADAARMLWARAVDRLKQEMANGEW
jgi:RNA polymerase sigma-70 factor (ECF subfamily)